MCVCVCVQHVFVYIIIVCCVYSMICFVYGCSDQLFCGIRFGCLNQLSLNMVKCQSVFDAIKRYGVAGKPLDQHEVREVGRLAEVGKHVIEEAAFDLVRSAQHKPLLFSYCGDGTPLKLKSFFVKWLLLSNINLLDLGTLVENSIVRVVS